MRGRAVHALYLPHDPLGPIGASQVRRVEEHRRNAVGGVCLLLMNDPGLVGWNIGHAGVFDQCAREIRQREIRVPDAAGASVVNHKGLLVEKGNTVSVKQTPDLCLSAGPVRGLVRSETILQADVADLQSWLT